MSIKTLVLLLAFMFSTFFVYGANVSVDIELIDDSIIYNYDFYFTQQESYSSFSFEKPRDARIIFARDLTTNESIPYSVAGDYFIFKPENIDGMHFKVKFTSREKYVEIIDKNTFSTYTNFNFPIDSLNFKFTTDKLHRVVDIFPRDYLISNGDTIIWEMENLTSDTLFLVNFESSSFNGADNNQDNLFNQYVWALILAFFVIVLFLAGLIFGKKYFSKEIKKDDNTIEVKKENIKEEKVDEDKKERESFDEIVQRYLTENEREVVEIVKENPGISQYDILNFLPSFTKSNLSKIISKLHAKKILNRIRVGKVNKIYLGEKLDSK